MNADLPPGGVANGSDNTMDDCRRRGEAHAEIAALRQQISDTEGWLATARQQALDLDAMRAEAMRERDEAQASYKRVVEKRSVEVSLHSEVLAKLAAAEKERDEGRAKLAELRAALSEIASAESTLELSGHCDNYTDAARAGESLARAKAKIAELCAEQGGEGA